MKCGNETPTSINETCCHSWCEQLTSCFSQLPPWKKDCVRMWRCRKNKRPRKQISIILTNTTDSSYLGRIKVKQCWKLNFPAIKLTPLSEVGVFYFFVTFVVPIVIGPLILPLQTLQKPIPLITTVRVAIDISSTFTRIMQSQKCNCEYVLSYVISISYVIYNLVISRFIFNV